MLLLLSAMRLQPAQAQTTTLTLMGLNDPVSSPFLSDLEVDYRRGGFPLQFTYTHPDDAPATFVFALTLEHNGFLLLDLTSAPVRFAPGAHSYSALNTPLTPGTPPLFFDRVFDQFPADFKRQLIRSGAFPEGFYTLTLEAIAEDQTVLGMPEVITFEVSYPEPPTLLGPNDAALITEQSFTFAWTPAVGTPRGTATRYELRIVEVLPFQTPEDALERNRPHTQIFTEDLTYSFVKAREFPLKTGVTYAWRVTAHVTTFEGRPLVVKDAGQTVAQTFHTLPLIELIPINPRRSTSGQAAAFEVRRSAGDLTYPLAVPYAVHRAAGKTETVELAEVVIPAHQNAATIEVAPRADTVFVASEQVWVELLDPQEGAASVRSTPVTISLDAPVAAQPSAYRAAPSIDGPAARWARRPGSFRTDDLLSPTELSPTRTPGSMAADAHSPDEPARRGAFKPLGSLGFVSEGFTTSREGSSRPPTSAQLFANTGFTTGEVRLGLKALYSSESREASQSLNRYGLEGAWRWINVAALDMTPTFSKYSLHGRSYRGGLLEATPGPLLLSATWGRSSRAVEADPDDPLVRPAFARWLYAVRLGAGQANGTHVHLASLFARDDTTSIQHPGGARPAESLSLSPDAGVSLFEGKFKVRLQGAVSAFTRDTRATAARVEDLDLPKTIEDVLLTGGLFTPRVGSRLDYVGEMQASLTLKKMSHTLVVERVMPGFESLGIGRLATDRQSIRLQSQAQTTWLNRSFRFGGQFTQSRNNLLDQRSSTQRQRQVSLTMQTAWSRHVVVRGGYTNGLTTNEAVRADAPNASQVQKRLLSQSATFSPTVTLRSGETMHVLSLNSSYQTLADKSLSVLLGERPGSGYHTINGTFSYSLTLPSSLALSATTSMQLNESDAREASSLGVHLAAGYAFFKRTLSVKLNAGLTHSDNTIKNTDVARDGRVQQWQLNLNAVYKLFNGDTVQLAMRGTAQRPFAPDQESARDLQATLRYEHRF